MGAKHSTDAGEEGHRPAPHLVDAEDVEDGGESGVVKKKERSTQGEKEKKKGKGAAQGGKSVESGDSALESSSLSSSLSSVGSSGEGTSKASTSGSSSSGSERRRGERRRRGTRRRGGSKSGGASSATSGSEKDGVVDDEESSGIDLDGEGRASAKTCGSLELHVRASQLYREDKKVEAADLLKEAIAVEAKSGTKAQELRSLRKLFKVYKRVGDLEGALEASGQVVAALEALGKDKEAEMATALHLHGRCFAKLDDDEEALRVHMRGLALRKSLFGKKGVPVAESLIHVAEAHYGLSSYEEAKDEVQEALRNFEENRSLVDDDDLANAYSLLGLLLFNTEENEEALEAYSRALALLKEVGEGPEADDHDALLLASCYHNIGLAKAAQEKPGEAIEYFEKSIAIEVRVYGANDDVVAESYTALAPVYGDAGRVEEGLALIDKALAIYEEGAKKAKRSKKNRSGAAAALHMRGSILRTAGDVAAASSAYLEAIQRYRSIKGSATMVDLALSLDGLALCQKALGATTEAQDSLTEALKIYTKVVGPASPLTLAAVATLKSLKTD